MAVAASCKFGHTERYPSGPCKECTRARARAWAIANPEASREHSKRYKEKNIDTVREKARDRARRIREEDPESIRVANERNKDYHREWQRANRDRINAAKRAKRAADPEASREYQRRWQKANREKVLAQNRARYAANPEKAAAATRAWQRKNPDKVRAIVAKRRARKLGVAVGCRKHYAEFVRWAKSEPSIECFYCGTDTTPDRRHLDHYVPLVRGGEDTVENLRVACPPCNLSKRDKMPSEFSPPQARR